MILYGASSHGKVVFSVVKGKANLFFDDNKELLSFCGLDVKAYDHKTLPDHDLVITIGNNKIRKLLSQTIEHNYSSIVSEYSILDSNVKVGVGSQLLHRCIIQTDTVIGDHTIINTNSNIDHDCELGDFVHIAPGCTLCGNVKVGEGTFIGAGSTVIPGVEIGKWSIIGAGSVVVNNIPVNVLAYGNPAKVIRNIE